MKHVFIVPDLHLWDKSFKNRIDYPGEVYAYITSLAEMMRAYKNDTCYLIFAGDIFHRNYSSVEGMTEVLNLFVELNRITNGNVYSVVGNHETSYPHCNPFWMMAKDHTSRFEAFKHVAAYGRFSPGIHIVDSLTVGELQFIFGHYGRDNYEDVDVGDTDLVLITHNAITESTIETTLENKYHRDPMTKYLRTTSLCSSTALPLTHKLKYVFVGHMHTMYSDFLVDEIVDRVHLHFYLRYLGSLGRTSIGEIKDNDLDRTIPHFVIADKGEYTYEPISLTLEPSANILKQQVVEDNENKREVARALKYLGSTTAFGETPVECIERGLSEYPIFAQLFGELYYNYTPEWVTTLLKEAGTL